MSELKRYVLIVQKYIMAKDDEDANIQARDLCEYEKSEYDNDCKVVSIGEIPFAGKLREVPVTDWIKKEAEDEDYRKEVDQDLKNQGSDHSI